MHLRFVEVFCDVAQRRSFSKGAAAQNVSQSSASQAVGLLEKRLGMKLIDRSKRPLELTAAGRVYYDGCRELLTRFRAIEDQVRQIHDRVAGTVRVAAIYSVGLMQMEQSEQKFAELYPEARLRVEYLHPDQVYEQVQSDEADLGLVSFPRHGGEIVSVDWQEQPIVLVVPPSHRLAGRRRIQLADLHGENYVGFTQDLTIRREVDRWLKRARIGVNVVHEFDNIETIKRAIEIGAGAALLPAPTVWQEISTGSLIALPITDVDLFRPLGIVHKRNQQLTAAVRKFIELLQQEADTAPGSPNASNPPPPQSNQEKPGQGRSNGAGRRSAGAVPRRKARARV